MERISNRTRKRAELALALEAAFNGCDQWTVVKPKRRSASHLTDRDPAAFYADLGSAVWEPSGRPDSWAARP